MMINGYNIKDVEFSHVRGNPYRNALDNLKKEVKKHFEKFGKIVQPSEQRIDNVINAAYEGVMTFKKEIITSPRPFTYEEQARLIVELYNSDYKGLVENKILPNYKNTITSVAYPKEDNSQYKIIPLSKKLLYLPQGFNQKIIETDYENAEGILVSKGKEKYDEFLTDKEYDDHPFYNNIIPDPKLRTELRKIIKQTIKNENRLNQLPEKCMAIFLNNLNPSKDYELAVSLYGPPYNYNYNTYADHFFNSGVGFLLVYPTKKYTNLNILNQEFPNPKYITDKIMDLLENKSLT